jgi:hypothetical protein
MVDAGSTRLRIPTSPRGNGWSGPYGPFHSGGQLGRPKHVMRGCFRSSITKAHTNRRSSMTSEKRPLRSALDDLAKVFRVDDDASPFPQNNILAVEFIQIFRDLLARGADDAGERLVTDDQGDQGSTRVG